MYIFISFTVVFICLIFYFISYIIQCNSSDIEFTIFKVQNHTFIFISSVILWKSYLVNPYITELVTITGEQNGCSTRKQIFTVLPVDDMCYRLVSRFSFQHNLIKISCLNTLHSPLTSDRIWLEVIFRWTFLIWMLIK
jgi:hypothetical protein